MERNRCPACGAKGYAGRKCRECGYLPFVEEVMHANHYHQGEPLVLKERPKVTPPGRGCDSFPGQRVQKIPLRLVAGVVMGIVSLAAFAENPRLGMALLAITASIFLNKKKT